MGIVLVIAVVVAVSYYISLRLWPWRNCGRCQGSGRNVGSTNRHYGRCGKCGGTGRKPRPGARAVNRDVTRLTNQGRRLSPLATRPGPSETVGQVHGARQLKQAAGGRSLDALA